MKKAAIITGIAVILAAAWYLGSPLFIDEVVDESFPIVSSEPQADGPAAANSVAQRRQARLQKQKMENLTAAEVEAMSEEERIDMQKEMNDLAKSMPDTVMDDPMPSAPEAPTHTIILSGNFQGTDDFHKGSGSAAVYTLPDDTTVLRFEDFSVTNGPALSVFLVKGTTGDMSLGSVNLGKLKGNKGNQNYPIPTDVDPAEYGSVLIYCVPFKVPFAVAPLQ